MKLLDGVNTVLGYLSEHPVTSLDTTYQSVDLVLDAIDRQRTLLLTEGWWFNTTVVQLTPDNLGRIATPANILTLYGEDCNVVAKGTYLVNLDDGSEIFNKPIKVKLINDWEFEELPNYAAHTVIYNAAIAVYTADFGVEGSVQLLQQYAIQARQQLQQEHFRNRRFNTSVGTRKVRSGRYGRGFR